MQVSLYLRSIAGGYAHWCPACLQMHPLPYPNRGWSFDGNLDRPTFSPSFKQFGKLWDMKTWKLGDPPPPDFVCHYHLIAGVLTFHADCTHGVRGQVPLPELPAWLQDNFKEDPMSFSYKLVSIPTDPTGEAVAAAAREEHAKYTWTPAQQLVMDGLGSALSLVASQAPAGSLFNADDVNGHLETDGTGAIVIKLRITQPS